MHELLVMRRAPGSAYELCAIGARCVVRRFVATDAISVAAVANDRRIWLQLRDLFPHPYHVADAERYIGRVAPVDPPLSLLIVVDGRAAGGVGLQPMTDVNRRTAEIGYWIGAAFWGRGIATEAVTLVTDWAFGAHGFLRIFAQPFAPVRIRFSPIAIPRSSSRGAERRSDRGGEGSQPYELWIASART